MPIGQSKAMLQCKWRYLVAKIVTYAMDSYFFCFNDIFDFGRAEPSLHVNDKDKQIMSMVWT